MGSCRAGEELSRADLLKATGFTEKSFLIAAREATDAFNELWQGYDPTADDVQNAADEALAQTPEELNSGLLLLNAEGELCVVARIYTCVGVGYVYRVLPLSI